jgi:predicted permease
VANWGIAMIRALTPPEMPVLGADRIGLDGRVLVFAFLLSIITGLMFGLIPAWHLASQDVGIALKDGSRTAGGVRRRVRLALVVGEIALASLLLVGTGLTLRSFKALLDADAGFRADGVLSVFVALPAARYPTNDRANAAFEEIARRLAAIPGIRAAGAVNHLPLTGQDSRTGVAIEAREPTPDAPTRAHIRVVTGDYFGAMGVAIVQGRAFTEADRADSPLVAIVNETMAARYWPGMSPLGKRFRIGPEPAWREVVGVVRDVRHWGLDRPVNPEFYAALPQRQHLMGQSLNYVVSTDGDPTRLAGAVREQLRSVDSDLPMSRVRTLEQVTAQSIASRRASMLLLGIFGALALVLAAAGIYGVMAHLVTLRTSEIGVRMTLGARPRDVMRLVLREGLLQAAAGLAIGLTGGVLLMRGFRTLLYGVDPGDPLTIAAVAVILTATALAACLVPARRAMRVDPVQALRTS